jgi:hydroxypyruvate reductase
MSRTSEQLRRDALAIWHAGVDAVRGDRLVRERLVVRDGTLHIADALSWPLEGPGRIIVVGTGKAGGAMAQGIEATLGDHWLAAKRVEGVVSVPADCVRPLKKIRLAAGRPAGRNEPSPEGAAIAEEILSLVGALGPDDLVLCLISGGGSALLPAPVAGVSLDTKLYLTRELSARGANIEELNCVRKQLSRIKGGRLAAACRAATLVSLIISDVLGDPLDVIASGLTVPDSHTPDEALAVLSKFHLTDDAAAKSAVTHLQRVSAARTRPLQPSCRTVNVVLANNAAAVDAAGAEAERLGYSHAMISSKEPEGPAEQVGRHLADMALRMRREDGPDCLISGGEPTVELADASVRGSGGRNQQLVLAALEVLGDCAGVALLSGGTDGEDGPTDAAGAIIDAPIAAAATQQGLAPRSFLQRSDAYHFFEPIDGLLKTGPTETNVCDVRVVVVDRGTAP